MTPTQRSCAFRSSDCMDKTAPEGSQRLRENDPHSSVSPLLLGNIQVNQDGRSQSDANYLGGSY